MSTTRTRVIAACLATGLSAFIVGCGGDDDSTKTTTAAANAAGPKTAKIVAIVDKTGIAGYGGELESKGLELGVKQLNASGKYDIDLEIRDSGSEQTQAVKLMNDAARSDADAVVYGPLSATALALAPIAARTKVPFIALQSGVDGVVDAGDNIFRVSTPQSRFYPSLFEYLGEQDVKKVASFYMSDSATIKELGDEVIPALAKEHGMELVNVGTVTGKQTDFKAIADKVVAAKPDAVFAGTQGAQNVTVITQLRRAGFEGLIFGSGGFAGGVLDPLGEKADGIVYPEWFSASTTLPVGKQFVTDYQAAYGKAPLTFAGEAFDATRLLQKALDGVEGEVTRESLLQGLVAATEAGFPAAQGEPLKFEDRDARGTGFIIRRDKGQDQIVKTPKSDQ